jgi:hypothetical protein
MGRLRNEEVRRLLRHLRQYVEDADRLAEIEDELRGEDAEEFLREPDLLAYFPELSEELTAGHVLWRLRVIPHAHLRMVQRGMTLKAVLSLFSRFIEVCEASGQIITAGPYTIFGRPTPHDAVTTLRLDVDTVTDASGQAHVVTVFIGRSDMGERTEVGPV